jgi:hypothetical protein
MFGLFTGFLSVLSLAYPFYNTLNLLTFLQSAYNNNAVATITDTMLLQRKDSIILQETLTYWILMALWFYLLQITPIAFIIKYLPLSSIAILYIQIWLGFPIIPITSTKKVSGAYIIYHYYFDNNMKHLKELQNQLTGILSSIGIGLANLIKAIPASNQVLTILGKDIQSMEQFFNQLNSKDKRNEVNLGLLNMMSSLFISAEENNDTLVTIIISSLVSPFGYTIYESDINSKFRDKSVTVDVPFRTCSSTGPPPALQQTGSIADSKTPSPTRSFDGFAIVSEKDLGSQEDLNYTMKNSKRGKQGTPEENYSRNSSQASNVVGGDLSDEKTGLLDSSRRISGSRHSSWFKH